MPLATLPGAKGSFPNLTVPVEAFGLSKRVYPISTTTPKATFY